MNDLKKNLKRLQKENDRDLRKKGVPTDDQIRLAYIRSWGLFDTENDWGGLTDNDMQS